VHVNDAHTSTDRYDKTKMAWTAANKIIAHT